MREVVLDASVVLKWFAAEQRGSFEVSEPELPSVASWISRGLTAYDAAYVALADRRELALVTDDDAIIELAPGISRALLGGSASAG